MRPKLCRAPIFFGLDFPSSPELQTTSKFSSPLSTFIWLLAFVHPPWASSIQVSIFLVDHWILNLFYVNQKRLVAIATSSFLCEQSTIKPFGSPCFICFGLLMLAVIVSMGLHRNTGHPNSASWPPECPWRAIPQKFGVHCETRNCHDLAVTTWFGVKTWYNTSNIRFHPARVCNFCLPDIYSVLDLFKHFNKLCGGSDLFLSPFKGEDGEVIEWC